MPVGYIASALICSIFIHHVDTHGHSPLGEANVARLTDLLLSTRLMRSYSISNRVNQVQNDDPECAMHVELELPPQARLFG